MYAFFPLLVGLGHPAGTGAILVVPLQEHGDCDGRTRRDCSFPRVDSHFGRYHFLGKVLLSSPSSLFGTEVLLYETWHSSQPISARTAFLLPVKLG